jgi:hypothetical protein
MVAIGGYFRLNYHRLLMTISGTILLMFISGYSINGYCLLFNWWLFLVIIGYIIIGYCKLYYCKLFKII